MKYHVFEFKRFVWTLKETKGLNRKYHDYFLLLEMFINYSKVCTLIKTRQW